MQGTRIFKICNDYTIYCKTKWTYNGFKHVAGLANEYGKPITRVSAYYLNRTWERFEYDTALQMLADKVQKRGNSILADMIRKYINNRTC